MSAQVLARLVALLSGGIGVLQATRNQSGEERRPQCRIRPVGSGGADPFQRGQDERLARLQRKLVGGRDQRDSCVLAVAVKGNLVNLSRDLVVFRGLRAKRDQP